MEGMTFDMSRFMTPETGAEPVGGAIHVSFCTKAVENPAKSKAENRPIAEDVDFIVKFKPGGDVIEKPVTEMNEEEVRLYGRLYERYRATRKPATEGTPLEEVPFLPASKVYEYKALGVFTLEQLAALSDGACQGMPHGALTDRAKAVARLEAAKEGATTAKLAQEKLELEQKLAALQEEVALLSAQVKANGKEEKKK